MDFKRRIPAVALGTTVLAATALSGAVGVAAAEMERRAELGIAPRDPLEDELLTRYAAGDGATTLTIAPILPDRAVVTRPETAITVHSEQSAVSDVASLERGDRRLRVGESSSHLRQKR